MKAMSLDMIGYMIIGLVGVALLLMLVQWIPTTEIFCSVYKGFSFLGFDPPPECESKTCFAEQVPLTPKTTEELARDIAAYSILCYAEKAGPACPSAGNRTVCYQLSLKNRPGLVYEEDVTRIMEDEGGCLSLQNSWIVGTDGNTTAYPGNCGISDNIVWEVAEVAVGTQGVILIEYNLNDDKIYIE